MKAVGKAEVVLCQRLSSNTSYFFVGNLPIPRRDDLPVEDVIRKFNSSLPSISLSSPKEVTAKKLTSLLDVTNWDCYLGKILDSRRGIRRTRNMVRLPAKEEKYGGVREAVVCYIEKGRLTLHVCPSTIRRALGGYVIFTVRSIVIRLTDLPQRQVVAGC